MKELVILIAAVSAFFYGDTLTNVLDMPSVHVSNSSQECVEVINFAPEDNYSCEDLPKIYHHVWVK